VVGTSSSHRRRFFKCCRLLELVRLPASSQRPIVPLYAMAFLGSLADAAEDVLDLEGLSSDLLDIWCESETQTLQHASDADALGAADFRLSLIERAVVAQWAQCALEATGLAEEGLAWTDVLNLLDACDAAWLAQGTGGRLGQSLPAACLAVVSILAKHEANCAKDATYSRKLMRLQRLILNSGTTLEMVHRQEKVCLNVIQWRTQVPSLKGWISIFTQRLSVLSTDSFEVHIHSARQNATIFAQSVLISSAADPRHPPCQLARALLALRLAQMGAIDFHQLCPQDFHEDEWEDLHLQVLSNFLLPASHSSFEALLDVNMLLVSLGCPIEQLQEACLLTLIALRSTADDSTL